MAIRPQWTSPAGWGVLGFPHAGRWQRLGLESWTGRPGHEWDAELVEGARRLDGSSGAVDAGVDDPVSPPVLEHQSGRELTGVALLTPTQPPTSASACWRMEALFGLGEGRAVAHTLAAVRRGEAMTVRQPLAAP